ncbi:MAG TPA: hypothetical protein VEB18_00920 [Candidatus Paceibacterota bacterium]|nr:hypothetical protein [Candidatus Paceibacterota bacterium]
MSLAEPALRIERNSDAFLPVPLTTPFSQPELRITFPGDPKFQAKKVFRKGFKGTKGAPIIEKIDPIFLERIPAREEAPSETIGLARLNNCASALLEHRERLARRWSGAALSWAAIHHIMRLYEGGKSIPMGEQNDFFVKVVDDDYDDVLWAHVAYRCSNWVIKRRIPGRYFPDRSVVAIPTL